MSRDLESPETLGYPTKPSVQYRVILGAGLDCEDRTATANTKMVEAMLRAKEIEKVVGVVLVGGRSRGHGAIIAQDELSGEGGENAFAKNAAKTPTKGVCLDHVPVRDEAADGASKLVTCLE